MPTPSVTIFYYQIYDFSVFQDKAKRPICVRIRRIPPQCQFREHRRHQREIVRNSIEHRMVSPVAHEPKGEL